VLEQCVHLSIIEGICSKIVSTLSDTK
jgi:hypothetical protein